MTAAKFLAALVAVLALTLPNGTTTPPFANAEVAVRPNIIVFLADDQRAGGGTMKVMPKTRRWFGTRGTRISNGYVTTPLCCPARATIFTGRYAHNHGVKDNLDAGASLDQASTIQAQLQEAGYLTGFYGKYFNGWDPEADPPYFHDFAVMNTNLDGFQGGWWNIDGRARHIDAYGTLFAGRQAIQLMREAERTGDSRPWAIFVFPSAPHLPAVPERKYRYAPVPSWNGNPAVFEADLSDKPLYVAQHEGRDLYRAGRWVRKKQLRSLMSVDDMVGEVMNEVRELGEGRRTLSFYTSDNGYFWGEHARDDKRAPYTESVRVPFYARWPGRIPPGGVDERFISNADIAPTIQDAASLTTGPVAPDGASILDTWTRDHAFTEYFQTKIELTEVPTWASLRTATYQYIENYGSDGVTIEFREYYDLVHDPWQLLNLLGDDNPANDPPNLQQLSDQLAADRTCRGWACP